VKEEINQFIEDSKWIAIGIAIGICVIEVSTSVCSVIMHTDYRSCLSTYVDP